MKIAYIISAYTDPQNLGRLVDALGNQCFFIHVDKKVDQTPFETELMKIGKENVTFIEDRVAVNWGGWGQVEYQKRLLQEVRRTGPYDRVVCIAGTDYPAVPVSQIENNFNSATEYLRAEIVTGNKDVNQKVTRYWKFDYGFQNTRLKKIARGVVNRLMGRCLWTIGIRKHDYIKQSDGSAWKVYFGSDYWALTYNCAMLVLDVMEKNHLISTYFQSAYAPSELVVPTIVCNSRYKNNVEKIYDTAQGYTKLCSLHYLIYDPLVQVMQEENYNDIVTSQKMFFRKAKTGESDKLIEMLKK